MPHMKLAVFTLLVLACTVHGYPGGGSGSRGPRRPGWPRTFCDIKDSATGQTSYLAETSQHTCYFGRCVVDDNRIDVTCDDLTVDFYICEGTPHFMKDVCMINSMAVTQGRGSVCPCDDQDFDVTSAGTNLILRFCQKSDIPRTQSRSDSPATVYTNGLNITTCTDLRGRRF